MTTIVVSAFAGLAAGIPGGITAWAALKEAKRGANEAEEGKEQAKEAKDLGIQNKAGIAEVHTVTNSRLSDVLVKLEIANKAVGELEEVKRQLAAMQSLLADATKRPATDPEIVQALADLKTHLAESVSRKRRR